MPQDKFIDLRRLLNDLESVGARDSLLKDIEATVKTLEKFGRDWYMEMLREEARANGDLLFQESPWKVGNGIFSLLFPYSDIGEERDNPYRSKE